MKSPEYPGDRAPPPDSASPAVCGKEQTGSSGRDYKLQFVVKSKLEALGGITTLVCCGKETGGSGRDHKFQFVVERKLEVLGGITSSPRLCAESLHEVTPFLQNLSLCGPFV